MFKKQGGNRVMISSNNKTAKGKYKFERGKDKKIESAKNKNISVGSINIHVLLAFFIMMIHACLFIQQGQKDEAAVNTTVIPLILVFVLEYLFLYLEESEKKVWFLNILCLLIEGWSAFVLCFSISGKMFLSLDFRYPKVYASINNIVTFIIGLIWVISIGVRYTNSRKMMYIFFLILYIMAVIYKFLPNEQKNVLFELSMGGDNIVNGNEVFDFFYPGIKEAVLAYIIIDPVMDSVRAFFSKRK